MNDTTPVLFTKDELWLLHSCIRHEQSPAWQGKWPPYSLELNDAIAEAILLCEDEKQLEAHVVLSKGDCLAIDHFVRDTMKSAAGTPIGKNILLKTFRARHRLAGGEVATASDPMASTTRKDVEEKVAEFETFRAAKARRRRKTQDA